jgi:hypothetical protein
MLGIVEIFIDSNLGTLATRVSFNLPLRFNTLLRLEGWVFSGGSGIFILEMIFGSREHLVFERLN